MLRRENMFLGFIIASVVIAISLIISEVADVSSAVVTWEECKEHCGVVALWEPTACFCEITEE